MRSDTTKNMGPANNTAVNFLAMGNFNFGAILGNNKKYNDWIEELISLIEKESGLDRDEILVTESEAKKHFEAGLTPHQVYFDEWQEDAGNFYSLPFAQGGAVKTKSVVEVQDLFETSLLEQSFIKEIFGDNPVYEVDSEGCNDGERIDVWITIKSPSQKAISECNLNYNKFAHPFERWAKENDLYDPTILSSEEFDGETGLTFMISDYLESEEYAKGGEITDSDLSRALNYVLESSVFSESFNSAFTYGKTSFATWDFSDAKEKAMTKKMQMQELGYATKSKKIAYPDLGRGNAYFVVWVKRKDTMAKGGEIIRFHSGQKYYVHLASVGNPDFREYFGEGILSPTLTTFVDSLESAARVVRDYILEYDLGGGNMIGGQVYDTGTNQMVAYISYNGRIWTRENTDKKDWETFKTLGAGKTMAEGGEVETKLYPGGPGYDEAQYKVEVHGSGDPQGHYVSNELRFKSEEAAKEYGKNLFQRWFGIDDWRVVPAFADGGEISGNLTESELDMLNDRGFKIKQFKDLLRTKFPDSFGFSLYKPKEGTRSFDLQPDQNTKSYWGIEDDSLKLYFPTNRRSAKSRSHELMYRVSQGQENTYFYFLLNSENGDEYIGSFGFKDDGDVPREYITGFIIFLHEAYGYPFQVKHSVFAEGGIPKIAKKIKVTIDDENSFYAWTFGDTWNGFEVPYFEKAEADKVAKSIGGSFDRVSRDFIFETFFKSNVINTDEGQKEVWPIGAYSWTWEKATDQFAEGGKIIKGVSSLLAMPKEMVEQIKESASMGFNEVVVGMISPKRKGVMLINKDYQVRGRYPLEYKEFVEQIVQGKYAGGGKIGGGLAELKRKLQKGVALKMVNFSGITDPEDPKGKGRIGKTRYIVKAQSNAIALNLDPNAKDGSWLEFPSASLLEITDNGFRIYEPGERELNEEEKRIIANAPKDPEQDRIDAMSDGSTMYSRRKNYYEESGLGYLYNNQWEGGLYYDTNKNKIKDKKVKGDILYEYEFVNSFGRGGKVKARIIAKGKKIKPRIKKRIRPKFYKTLKKPA